MSGCTEGDQSGWFTVHWTITHPLLSLEIFPRYTNQRGRMEQGGSKELRRAKSPGKSDQKKVLILRSPTPIRDQLWTATSNPSSTDARVWWCHWESKDSLQLHFSHLDNSRTSMSKRSSCSISQERAMTQERPEDNRKSAILRKKFYLLVCSWMEKTIETYHKQNVRRGNYFFFLFVCFQILKEGKSSLPYTGLHSSRQQNQGTWNFGAQEGKCFKSWENFPLQIPTQCQYLYAWYQDTEYEPQTALLCKIWGRINTDTWLLLLPPDMGRRSRIL